ncbi:hypothetical protein KR018_009190, partial [Drosophila ironensis]
CPTIAMRFALLLCLIFVLRTSGAHVLRRGTNSDPLTAVQPDVPSGVEVNEVDIDDSEEDETTELGVASIKVRHIKDDPELCEFLSRYHPHHPQCHSYCKRQGHWMGQCKKARCHCFS